MAFSNEQLQDLAVGYSQIANKYEELLLAVLNLNLEPQAKEYAEHGFSRRLKTLKRCIDQVFNIAPPERESKLHATELDDISIYLQAFVFNTFGAIDNLAWIWVKQKKISYAKNQDVRFSNPAILSSFSDNFQMYLGSLSKWFSFQEGFRHALAHRIPLYVPPFVITEKDATRYKEMESKFMNLIQEHKFEEYEKLREEQDALGKFVPWMMHSFSEGSSPVTFHAQMLEDWEKITELANKFIHEIKT